jgi:Tfp pilus assembly protein PilX
MTARGRSERGAALLIALMCLMLMTGLGLALVLTTSTETLITGNFKHGSEGMYAADAGVERVMQDLLTVPDWNAVLAGQVTSPFIDGPASGVRTMADGTTLNLAEATNMINCRKVTTCSTTEMNTSTEERPWSVDNPRWTLYAYGPLGNMLTGTLAATINSQMYVVVWVADDPSENDGNPLQDGNAQTNPGSGVLAMRAEAFGPNGTHRVIEATVARTDTSEIERGYTGQRGQDEQNRRARKAAVQTPGRAMTRQELTLATGALQ